jgi:hypothetical protein
VLLANSAGTIFCMSLDVHVGVMFCTDSDIVMENMCARSVILCMGYDVVNWLLCFSNFTFET